MLKPAGLVTIVRCDTCGTLDPGPRFCCIACGATALVTVAVPGRGTLVTWTLIRRPPEGFATAGPLAVGVVELDAGVRVTGRLNLEAGEPMLGARMVCLAGEPSNPIFAMEPP